MLLRLSGTVLNTISRKGESKVTKNPYRLTDVVVLVGNRGVATYTINELADDAPRPPHRFDVVDVLAEFEVYNGNLSGRYVADVDPAEASIPLADLVTS